MSKTRHYSYDLYAERAMADRFEASRFSGPIGERLAQDQARVLEEFLGDVSGRRILDVGTGTGRAGLLLVARGGRVVGVDASAAMLQGARQRAGDRGLPLALAQEHAHALAFGAHAFDDAVSLRVLMHAPDWRRCVAELCRVASRRVVVDFPSATGFAVLEAIARRVQAGFGRQVEAYRVLRLGAVRRVFARHGFEVRRVHRQFVLPIAWHKWRGDPEATAAIERRLAAVGLCGAMGSPVTVMAERCAS